MDKTFDFKSLEENIYERWEGAGVFTPAILPGVRPYTIIMPPPNAYDRLHIGHALFVALQDIMVRYHRMRGVPTLWLPGADHAGIASQVFYEKLLQKERRLSRYDLGREKFVEELAEFIGDKRQIMESQLRRLGASCDWTRSKYTLDPDVSLAVTTIFKKLHDDGLIYRKERIINWCPKNATALSDLEVIHKETEGTLTHIKYPLVDGGEIVVATTRPETMLGDTAVAVNPKDPRYQSLIGRSVRLPLMDREIPIVADEVVAIDFGTGAVKVTPAHSETDYEIASRHGLPMIVVIDTRARINDLGGEFAGLKVGEAREQIVEKLRNLGLIVKEEKIVHSVGWSERGDVPVEPMPMLQWFVKIEPLAKPAIEAVKSGKIRFVPERFEKNYLNWMENIHDWNISRQLWWGHRVPVYYAQSDPEKYVVAASMDEAEKILGESAVQDPDTLDTWFSSGLWPFTTLGWPGETPDFKYFYPTTVMETGWDIIFFWVARMIMLGLYATGQPPFELVYINGLVRDAQGQKISKSKGNVVDPIDMVEKYGADALRMGLIIGTAPGSDTNISEDKIRAYRNFANKIWNAARFLEMAGGVATGSVDGSMTSSHPWLAEWREVKAEIHQLMGDYQIALAGERMYHYFWHRFCDELIEEAKPMLADPDKKPEAAMALGTILRESLIMLHPFVPFVTEAVWQELFAGEGQLIVQKNL